MSEEPKKTRGVVDIVFLMDATASMTTCIDKLKENISTFVDSMCDTTNQENPVRDWRAKVVGYRDFIDDPASALEDNPFVTEAATVQSQLNALEAKFGGDLPESLLDAIHHVANMGQIDKGAQEIDPNKWRYRSSAARVVIIFTDADYHPTTKDGGTFDDIVLACTSNRILLFIFAPEMDSYDQLSEIDKSEYEPIEVQSGEQPADALERFVSAPDAFKKAMEQLGKSVSASAAVPEL
jgi:hypothetical protein